MDTLFISDLHLSEERPEKFELFRELFRGPARQAAAVYILGDLFERFWMGNDDLLPPNRDIIAELADFTHTNHKLSIIRGNRDLFLDQHIETVTGCTLLPDMSVIELDSAPVLLMHGDILCTRDVKYQTYRKLVDRDLVKRFFFALPYSIRHFAVRGLRSMMRQSVLNKPADIIDVDPSTVIETMRQYKVLELIHGHTHRPGIHEFQVDGKPAKRIVLGDWYEKDSVLVCRDSKKTLMRVRDYIDSV